MRLHWPQWLTFGMGVAFTASSFSAAQSHFLQGPFTKLLQNQGLEHTIPRLNAIASVAAIVGSLVVMFWINDRNVKRLTLVAYVGNAVCPFLYMYAFSTESEHTLTVVRIVQIWLAAVGFGGTSTILRLVFPKDSSNHQKANALNMTLWAVAATLANVAGFILIDSLLWWSLIGSVLNVLTFFAVTVVKLPMEQQKEKKKHAVPLKEWRRLAKGHIPALGSNIVYLLAAGYAPLYIEQNWLAGMCLTLFILSVQVGAWISPVTSAKWSEKKTMRMGQIGMVCGLFLAWANSIIPPYALLLGALVMGISYGAHENAFGFLINDSTKPEFTGAAVGMGKLVTTSCGLIVAGLAGWVGIDDILWLMGVPVVALGFLYLPFISYSSVNKSGDANSQEPEKE